MSSPVEAAIGRFSPTESALKRQRRSLNNPKGDVVDQLMQLVRAILKCLDLASKLAATAGQETFRQQQVAFASTFDHVEQVGHGRYFL